jgi:hypothetical protein
MPAFEDVRSAAEILSGHALRTPVRSSPIIDAALGATVFFKCENLQRGGAFKFRGAFHTLSKLPKEQLQRGVGLFVGQPCVVWFWPRSAQLGHDRCRMTHLGGCGSLPATARASSLRPLLRGYRHHAQLEKQGSPSCRPSTMRM